MNGIELLEEYTQYNNQKLNRIACALFTKFGGLSQMDYDDFYSIANEVLWRTAEEFDDSKNIPFESYLKFKLLNKFKTEMTKRNRDKRSNSKTDEHGERIYFQTISMDTAAGDITELFEKIDSGFLIENELSEEFGLLTNERVDAYLQSLSPTQRRIACFIMDGYKPCKIRERLKITEKEYSDSLKNMKTFEKARILRHADYVQSGKEKTMNEVTQTLEKSKPGRMSIASIIKKIDSYTIRFDHSLQRPSELWPPAMKGNLVSDILQGNPIPPLVFAEQIANGLAIIWDLDGKQRCTSVYSFKNDAYKISKNIRRWNITFQATIKDGAGKPILDSNGFPQSERKEFDIRGRKFSDLPEELQDRFLEYNFEIVQYLNCSSEDIAYHIARYNEGKPMSASQKGITRLGEEFASIVKSISAMSFFKEQGGYKVSEGANGTVNRVVVESVMAANFLDDWKKKQEDMCEFIKENATLEMFDCFEDMVSRISKIGTDIVFNMFDSKDSFLWFCLFAKCIDMGIEDKKFIAFMTEFEQSLHNKDIDGITFDDLNGKSTKDKAIVINKISHLTKLMMEFLHIESRQAKGADNVLADAEQFISDNMNIDANELHKDMDFYEQSLNDLVTHTIRDDSKLLKPENRISLLAMVVYSYREDVDLEKWMTSYARNNNTYDTDQKKNYLHMKNDFEISNSKIRG